MKSPIISISVFLVLITLISSVHTMAKSQEKDENLIETTCKNTPIYQLCIATLRADPGSNAADVAGLALIMIGAVEAKSKEALSAVKNLLKSGSGNTEALKQCKDKYKAVLEGDVPVAKSAVRGNPKFAEGGMADAKVEADDCEDGFGGKSPLTKVNGDVRDLAVVARAIIRNLL
ncbi:hypothetical protein ABFS83_14G002700 [Erythranthe nasuta]